MKICLRIIFLLMLSINVAFAASKRPLPAVSLQGLANTQQSNQLSPNDRWVLIYITKKCTHCESLLDVLDTLPDQLAAKKIVVVIGGDGVDAVKDWVKQHKPVDQGGWYTDADFQLKKQLSLTGAPVILGIERGQVMWTHPGMDRDEKTMRAIISGWAP